MVLSSDILPIGPMVGLYAATTRKGMSGEVYGPDEAISMEEALVGYTRNGAFVTREEDIKGTLAPGMLADVVVLSDDPRGLRAGGHPRDRGGDDDRRRPGPLGKEPLTVPVAAPSGDRCYLPGACAASSPS